MRLPAAERELSHSPRIFHGGCTVCLNIGSELLKLWCAILGLNQLLACISLHEGSGRHDLGEVVS